MFCDLSDGFDGGLVLNVFAVSLVVLLFAEIIETSWASFGDRPANVAVRTRTRINDSTLHVSNICRCAITRGLAQNGKKLSLQREKTKTLYLLSIALDPLVMIYEEDGSNLSSYCIKHETEWTYFPNNCSHG